MTPPKTSPKPKRYWHNYKETPFWEKDRREDLYKYMWGIIRNRNGHLYRIGGVEDHVHILTSLHPSIALGNFIKNQEQHHTKESSANELKRLLDDAGIKYDSNYFE